jgi:hypothetical protein
MSSGPGETTGARSGGPSQTITGGNSASATTVRTSAPPTGGNGSNGNGKGQGQGQGGKGNS